MWDGGLQVSIGGRRLYGTDDNGCEWLVNDLSGVWDGVGTTHEHSARAWGDGWFANRSWRTGRSIVVGGVVVSPSAAAFAASRQALLSVLGADDTDLLVDAHGVRRLYRVRQDSGEPQIAPYGHRAWKFSIPLVSMSPYAFDAGDPLTGSTGLPSSSGGMRFPVVFSGGPPSGSGSGAVPWCFSEQVVSGNVSLSNPGGAPSPVSLRVDGPVKDPRVEHLPSGGVLELRAGLGAGHFVVFDGATRQVLIDGRDPARGAVVRRGWSDALPGLNVWRFSAGEHSPGARLSVSFRGAYL